MFPRTAHIRSVPVTSTVESSPPGGESLATRVDACLPQTQCTRCGFRDCRDYAQAVAAGAADFNRCAPGGDVTLHALAALLGLPPKPIDPACGSGSVRERAVIDEARCIGCRKCLDACPVDAIVGAHRSLHTVLAGECSGCGLCLPPCPVDCIAMEPATSADRTPWPQYDQAESVRWRKRAEARRLRLAADKAANRRAAATAARVPPPAQMREEIRAAVERVRARKGNRKG
jgi:electron transport complex protein RnfB